MFSQTVYWLVSVWNFFQAWDVFITGCDHVILIVWNVTNVYDIQIGWLRGCPRAWVWAQPMWESMFMNTKCPYGYLLRGPVLAIQGYCLEILFLFILWEIHGIGWCWSGVGGVSVGELNESHWHTSLGGVCSGCCGVAGSGLKEACSRVETWWILGIFLNGVGRSLLSVPLLYPSSAKASCWVKAAFNAMMNLPNKMLLDSCHSMWLDGVQKNVV